MARGGCKKRPRILNKELTKVRSAQDIPEPSRTLMCMYGTVKRPA
ncbi:hypothetical protein AB7M56_004817 [Bradyrhizobium elkanii]|nr:hypothetical protein [Bradyrhizobium elkanii]MCS4006081.1 hypothetical protein [Bradyrhizobium elkanii USDA 61]MCS3517998.1 hypothetical protein [Bradyrhizobium elkanii]MCS3578792.1 hypothetical protein [Bradyrhizobium elkanii]MCS3690592.1 hypothetical protein [Bradyrhizobium elkanii]